MTAGAGMKSQKPGGYQVGRAGGVCSVCSRAIAPDEKFVAAVRETPNGLERLDIDLSCWASFDQAGLLGFWQTVMPHGEQKKKIFVDDEVLCSLFERLADATEPAKLNFRFVLGLILMRKRLVIYDTTRHDEGRDVWLVRLRGREDQLELLDPKLDESQVGEVGQQLNEILNQEL